MNVTYYPAFLRRFCYPLINATPFCSIRRGTLQQVDPSILEMALHGYEAELQKIQGAMAAIRKQLGMRGNGGGMMRIGRHGDGAKAKHHMSAAGRKHIADAQK